MTEERERIQKALRCLISAHKKERQIIKWLEENTGARMFIGTSREDNEDGAFLPDGFDEFLESAGISKEKAISNSDGTYLQRSIMLGGMRFHTLEEENEIH